MFDKKNGIVQYSFPEEYETHKKNLDNPPTIRIVSLSFYLDRLNIFKAKD